MMKQCARNALFPFGVSLMALVVGHRFTASDYVCMLGGVMSADGGESVSPFIAANAMGELWRRKKIGEWAELVVNTSG